MKVLWNQRLVSAIAGEHDALQLFTDSWAHAD